MEPGGAFGNQRGICGEKLGRCGERGRVSLTLVPGDLFCSVERAFLQQKTFTTLQLYPFPHPDDFLSCF